MSTTTPTLEEASDEPTCKNDNPFCPHENPAVDDGLECFACWQALARFDERPVHTSRDVFTGL